MPSSDTTVSRFPRASGPLQTIGASLSRQLLGFAVAAIGIQLSCCAVEESTATLSAVIRTAIGMVVILNGLFLDGFCL